MTFASLAWPEIIGYMACGLVFLTFCMKRMLPLRVIAVTSNIAFIFYGLAAELMPILVLHATLLPLNIYRSVQKMKETKAIRMAAEGRADIEVLIPFMTRRRFARDTLLFRKGDVSDAIYFVGAGNLLIVEIDTTLGPGSLVGEIGIFRPDKKRTGTVLCQTDCDLYAISEKDVQKLFLEEPRFGIFITKLIASRLVADNTSEEQPYLLVNSL